MEWHPTISESSMLSAKSRFGEGTENRLQKASSTDDRRQWDRLPISIPFFVHGPVSPNGRFVEFGTALNISAGGALLATRHYLEVGTQIIVEMAIGLTNEALLPHPVRPIPATVLRTRRSVRCFLVALKFDHLLA